MNRPMSGERKLRQRPKKAQDVCVGPALSTSVSSNPSLQNSEDNVAKGSVGCLQHGTASINIAWYIMLFKLTGKLFEFVLGHIRSLAKMVKQMVLWTVPKAPTSRSTSVVSKESTVLLDVTNLIMIKELLRNLSDVIPDLPQVVDLDSVRYDQFNNLCLILGEGMRTVVLRLRVIQVRAVLKKVGADIQMTKDQLRDLQKGGCTVDEYQNCTRWGLQMIKEFEAVQEKIMMEVRNIEEVYHQIIS